MEVIVNSENLYTKLYKQRTSYPFAGISTVQETEDDLDPTECTMQD